MRIAFFTPLSPKRSGIADYSEALLPHLAAQAGTRAGTRAGMRAEMQVEMIDVFTEDPPAGRAAQPNICVRPIEAFERDADPEAYDVILYQMGNNPFHVAIYEQALRVPGVVVLHEFNLHHLLAAVTIARGDWDGYFREVEYNGDAAALERARLAQAGDHEPDYDNLAMNRRLIERSQGLIVHSEYMVRAVRQAGYHLPVRKILHGVEIPDVDRAKARRRLAELAGLPLNEATPVFGIFGFLKPYKRIHEALRAFARMRTTHPQARMVLVGEEHAHYPLRPLIAELGIGDAVGIAGYVPPDDFAASIAACDVCINLRWPTVGETSGSLLRALAFGKPTLVSEVGTFLEYPDDVAIKIPVNHRETDWLYEYMRALLDEPTLARAVGERARAYAAQECAWPKVAGEYVEFLEEMVSSGRGERQANAVPEDDAAPAAKPPSGNGLSGKDLEEYIVSFSHDSQLMEEYALSHLKRLVRTVQVTPPGGPEDRVLELGCYMQMTPALRAHLGYGEVFGAYYGPLGKHHEQSATSSHGETFFLPDRLVRRRAGPVSVSRRTLPDRALLRAAGTPRDRPDAHDRGDQPHPRPRRLAHFEHAEHHQPAKRRRRVARLPSRTVFLLHQGPPRTAPWIRATAVSTRREKSLCWSRPAECRWTCSRRGTIGIRTPISTRCGNLSRPPAARSSCAATRSIAARARLVR